MNSIITNIKGSIILSMQYFAYSFNHYLSNTKKLNWWIDNILRIAIFIVALYILKDIASSFIGSNNHELIIGCFICFAIISLALLFVRIFYYFLTIKGFLRFIVDLFIVYPFIVYYFLPYLVKSDFISEVHIFGVKFLFKAYFFLVIVYNLIDQQWIRSIRSKYIKWYDLSKAENIDIVYYKSENGGFTGELIKKYSFPKKVLCRREWVLDLALAKLKKENPGFVIWFQKYYS